jgi:hypothetical protein
LVAKDGTTHYEYFPVNVVESDGATVTINVNQTWKEGRIDWIAVGYEETGDYECTKTHQVDYEDPAGSPYTTTCEYIEEYNSNVAFFDVIVFDDTFSKEDDNPTFSEEMTIECGISVGQGAGAGYKVYYRFVVPCQEECGITPTPTERPSPLLSIITVEAQLENSS